MSNSKPLLEVDQLVVEYHAENDSKVRAVDQVSFDLTPGEVLGLVGESGCGKSTLGLSLMRLLKGGSIKSGKIIFNGENFLEKSPSDVQKMRGDQISMIFQASQNVLNPTQKVRHHFIDTLQAHGQWNSEKEQDIYTLLEKLEIPSSRLNDYPFQFSGGMQQRIVIALSLLLNPQLLIADEPTTALDVLVQARILKLMKELKEELNLTMILISHDLGVVAENSTRVAIMYAGQLVEIASVESIFKNPKHPYTEALIRAIPDVRDMEKSRQESIPGSPPDLKNPSPYCRFAPRCRYKEDVCTSNRVDLIQLDVGEEDSRQVRCLKYDKTFEKEFRR